MPQELLLQVSPEIAVSEQLLKEYVAKLIRVSTNEIKHISILKRSIDARQKAIKMNLKVIIYFQGDEFIEEKTHKKTVHFGKSLNKRRKKSKVLFENKNKMVVLSIASCFRCCFLYATAYPI